MKTVSIRATPVSLGGAVLGGLLLFVGVLVFIAFQPEEPSTMLRVILSVLWIGLLLYFIDAASERLAYRDGMVLFDSLFKAKHELRLRDMDEVLVVHEGLNQERGIISARFKGRDGQAIEWPLGPLWHRHTLEAFFSTLESETGKRKLVQHVR